MLKGVILNLLLNAAQAMGGAGVVRAHVQVVAGECRIAIRDEGPGIPADVREKVFEPFFTTKHRGTGLGLAIARRNVELHEGTLDVECPSGGGTIVTIALPARPPAPDRAGAPASAGAPETDPTPTASRTDAAGA
jgi:signal transduction histidine kinase